MRIPIKTLAYIAGIIDADGTIGVKRSTYEMRKGCTSKQPIYSERVCVRQVEPHAIDLLHDTFGGTRYMSKPSAKRGRYLHSWQVTDLKAARFLKVVISHLRIKKKQAENCLALRAVKERSKKLRIAKKRGHVGASPRSKVISDEMERLYLIAKELNRVGIR